MGMRSDQERDQCIDMLMAKVQALENEVVQLRRGVPLQSSVSSKPNDEAVRSRPSVKPKLTSRIPQSTFPDSTLENAIGTRWIGRVGVVIFILGIAFFLKYSFDNNLIGEAGRVMLGILCGAAFLGAGEFLQSKKTLALYGQLLSGCGLAVLYLSFYAAFAFYHLIPAPAAAIGMVAITTTGMVLAIRYSAYPLSVVVLLGGFLTPLMLSTGENQPIALFSYLLLLNTGTLLLQRYRQWPSLVASSLGGTVILYISWHIAFYSAEQQWIAFGAVTTFFLCFNLYILLFRLESNKERSEVDQLIIFSSALFFFLAFLAQQNFIATWPVKFFALLLAGFEIALAEFAQRRSKGRSLTVVLYTAVSLFMTVVATFIVFEQRWLLPALSIEMVLLGWCWFRLNIPAFHWGVYLLALIVFLRFFDDIQLNLSPFEKFVPLFNGRFLVCSVTVGCFYLLQHIVSQHREKLDKNERLILVIIFFITQALSLIILSVEAHDFIYIASPVSSGSGYAFQLSLSVIWGLYASLLTAVGIYNRIRKARIAGILLLGVTVLKVFLLDLSTLEPLFRIVSFIVLGLLLLAVSYGYNRFRDLIFGEDQP